MTFEQDFRVARINHWPSGNTATKVETSKKMGLISYKTKQSHQYFSVRLRVRGKPQYVQKITFIVHTENLVNIENKNYP